MKIKLNYLTNWKFLLAITSLVVGFTLSFLLVDIRFAIIYLLIWFDRVVIAYTKILWELGIETYITPIIFAGILYGPVFGFLLGFIILPIMDVIRYIISPPITQVVWPPLIPSPDSFVDGIPGAIAGYLHTYLSLTPLVFVAVIIRTILTVLKDAAYGIPPKPMYIINIIYNIFISGILAFILLL